MELLLRNNKGEIVGKSLVDEEDFEKFKVGFWSLTHGYASGKFGKLKLMEQVAQSRNRGQEACVTPPPPCTRQQGKL